MVPKLTKYSLLTLKREQDIASLTHQYEDVLYNIYYFRDDFLTLPGRNFDKICALPFSGIKNYFDNFNVLQFLIYLLEFICKLYLTFTMIIYSMVTVMWSIKVTWPTSCLPLIKTKIFKNMKSLSAFQLWQKIYQW